MRLNSIRGIRSKSALLLLGVFIVIVVIIVISVNNSKESFSKKSQVQLLNGYIDNVIYQEKNLQSCKPITEFKQNFILKNKYFGPTNDITNKDFNKEDTIKKCDKVIDAIEKILECDEVKNKRTVLENINNSKNNISTYREKAIPK